MKIGPRPIRAILTFATVATVTALLPLSRQTVLADDCPQMLGTLQVNTNSDSSKNIVGSTYSFHGATNVRFYAFFKPSQASSFSAQTSQWSLTDAGDMHFSVATSGSFYQAVNSNVVVQPNGPGASSTMTVTANQSGVDYVKSIALDNF